MKKYSQEEIENYAAGTMPSADRQAFEASLADDVTLREQYQLHLDMQAAVNDKEAIEVEGMLSQISSNYNPKAAPKTRHWWPIALLLLLLLLALLLWKFSQRPSHQQLYADYYQAYEAFGIKRGNPQDQALFQQALKAYAKGDYTNALQGFNAINGDDNALLFYTAATYQALSDCQNAHPLWDAIIASEDSDWRIQTSWYKALCYLHSGNVEAAKPLLEDLCLTDNPFAADATKLLQQLTQ